MSIDPARINLPGFGSEVFAVLRTHRDAIPILEKVERLQHPVIWLATPNPFLDGACPGIEILSRKTERIQKVGEAVDIELEAQKGVGHGHREYS